MKKTLANSIRALIVILILASAAMCIWWLEKAIDYVLMFLRLVYTDGVVPEWMDVLIRVFCGIVITPLFAILLMSFSFPSAIEKDMTFSDKTATLLHVIGMILVSDCTVFCAMLSVLLFYHESFVSPLLIFVGVLGITIGCMLLVLARYVKRAAALKEEADCTL